MNTINVMGAEEVGEVAQAMQGSGSDVNAGVLKDELTQVAAVALVWLTRLAVEKGEYT